MKQFYEKKEKKIKNKYLSDNNKLFQSLLNSNSHLGSNLKSSNPKSFDYVYGKRNNQLILDLDFTIQSLKRSFLLINKLLKKKRKILIICNDLKTQYLKRELSDTLIKKQIKFITQKWSGGFITNPLLLDNQLKNISLVISFNDTEDNLVIKEVTRKKIPLVSVSNVNIDPNLINYPILINHNNVKSVFFLTFLFKKYFKI